MRWISRCLEAVLTVVCVWSTPSAATQTPIQIMDRWELLVDCHLIEQMDGGVEVLSKPLLFEGDEHVVNFSTSCAGGLRVGIMDLSGRSPAGYGLSQCPEIYGDAIDHTVKWQSGSDVSSLAGKPIRLRFALRDADLYAFGFRNR